MYLTYRKWCWVSRVIAVAGIAFVVAGVFTSGGVLSFRSVLTDIGLGLLVLMAVLATVTLKCPKCGTRIPEGLSHKIVRCPHCDRDLR